MTIPSAVQGIGRRGDAKGRGSTLRRVFVIKEEDSRYNWISRYVQSWKSPWRNLSESTVQMRELVLWLSFPVIPEGSFEGPVT